MTDPDLMLALRESYQEVRSRRRRIFSDVRPENLSDLRRYLRYFMDALDILLDIQRDRRWRREGY